MYRRSAALLFFIACLGTLSGTTGCAAVARQSLRERWAEAMRTKQWVTAFNDGTRKDVVPVRVDSIVVKIGGRENIAFRAGPDDVEIGGPIISPDGTRLAFVKTHKENGRYRTAIYSMATDGSALRSPVELAPPRLPIKGAQTGASPVAWSHDNKRLLFFVTLKDEALARPAPLPGSPLPPQSLSVLEVDSGRLVTLLPAIGRRVHGSGVGGPVITSQAWAPDGRRLVYMDDRGHVMIMDTVTRSNIKDLGPGVEPTWSPDGRFIAFQEPAERARRSDFVIYAIDGPSGPTPLMSNTVPRFFPRRGTYYGPAVWSPDSQYLKMVYSEPEIRSIFYGVERYYPSVFDRLTGETTKLPFRSLGPTWGGRP